MKKSALEVIRLLKHNNSWTLGHTVGLLEFTACVVCHKDCTKCADEYGILYSSNGLLNK